MGSQGSKGDQELDFNVLQKKEDWELHYFIYFINGKIESNSKCVDLSKIKTLISNRADARTKSY